MKVYYLASSTGCFYAIVYAKSNVEAFDKMWKERKEFLEKLGLSKDWLDWTINEFREDTYDGVLCFY